MFIRLLKLRRTGEDVFEFGIGLVGLNLFLRVVEEMRKLLEELKSLGEI
jgi:hypothetical protein